MIYQLVVLIKYKLKKIENVNILDYCINNVNIHKNKHIQ